MKYIELNKNSSTPLYAQIKDSIKLAIKNETLKPNDKLPTEEEICTEFGISRPVVRQAYKELLDENFIVRFKGRGTFVRETEIRSMFFSEFIDIETDLLNMGYHPKVRLIAKEVMGIGSCSQNIRNLFNVSTVLKVKLVYLNQNIPLVFKEGYYPLELMNGIQDLDFENSPIYDALESRFSIWLSHIRRTVDAQIVQDELANVLEMEKEHAIHFVESTAYDDRDRVVEFAYSYYVGDRNEFDLMVYKQFA